LLKQAVKPKFLGSIVFRNAAFNAFRFLAFAAMATFLTPYTLHRLGAGKFGLWAMGAGLAVYRLSNFGVTRSLMKFVAAASAMGDYDTVGEYASSAVALFIVSGSFLALVVVLFRDPIVTFLRVPSDLRYEGSLVIAALVVVAAIDLVLSVFGSVLDGYQRMDITSTIMTTMRVVNAFGVVVALELGKGLKGLVLNQALTTVLSGLAAFYTMRWLFPGVKISLASIRIPRVRALFNYGIHIQASEFLLLLRDPFNKGLLSHMLGIEYAGYYEIATKLPCAAFELLRSATMALFPALAKRHSERDWQRIQNLCFRSVALVSIIAVPVFSLLAMIARPLLHIWLGRQTVDLTEAVQMLTFGWLVAALAIPLAILTQACGKPQLLSWSLGAGSVVNVFCAYALIPRLGFNGVIAGVTIAVLTDSLVLYALFSKQFSVIRVQTFRDYIPLKALTFLVAFAFALYWAGHFGASRPVALCLTSALIYLFLSWLLLKNTGMRLITGTDAARL
jgi:O-antigen/teichoic acid export membrane protein